jgi:hypothetical protein
MRFLDPAMTTKLSFNKIKHKKSEEKQNGSICKFESVHRPERFPPNHSEKVTSQKEMIHRLNLIGATRIHFMLERGRREKIPSHLPDEIFPEEFETFMHLKFQREYHYVLVRRGHKGLIE